jgi:hypothetical protein
VPRGTVIFLSYGQGPHVAETVFSVLSAWRRSRTQRDVGLLVYTDDSGPFIDLPVPVRTITDAELLRWQPPGAYPRRCKPAVISDALRTLDHPVALIDSDTWFRRSPRRIFDRIAPGRVALHVNEGPLGSTNCRMKRDFITGVREQTFHDARGRQIRVAEGDGMWNSGVSGIHPADAHLLDDTVVFLDQLWQTFPQGIFLEQFALSATVARVAKPRATDDIVYHYWLESLRRPWRQRLPELLADTAHLPPGARADVLHHQRPRAQGLEAARFVAKQAWRSLGQETRSVRSSAT